MKKGVRKANHLSKATFWFFKRMQLHMKYVTFMYMYTVSHIRQRVIKVIFELIRFFLTASAS